MTKFQALKGLRENTNSMLELEFYINKIYDEFEKEIDANIEYLAYLDCYEYENTLHGIEALQDLKEKIL